MAALCRSAALPLCTVEVEVELEVNHLPQRRRIERLKDLPEVQGLAHVPARNHLLAAVGGLDG